MIQGGGDESALLQELSETALDLTSYPNDPDSWYYAIGRLVGGLSIPLFPDTDQEWQQWEAEPRRYLHLSRVYQRVAEKKRRKQQDCLHKASHLIAHRLAERAVVIGDLSQRQMVMKKKEGETPKEQRKRQIRNRMVYNDWGLYGFVQMLKYKCLHVGKELHTITERDTTRTCHVCKGKKDMPLWVRTYRYENCGLVMDRDDNSAVNIYERFLAGPPPHTSVI